MSHYETLKTKPNLTRKEAYAFIIDSLSKEVQRATTPEEIVVENITNPVAEILTNQLTKETQNNVVNAMKKVRGFSKITGEDFDQFDLEDIKIGFNRIKQYNTHSDRLKILEVVS